MFLRSFKPALQLSRSCSRIITPRSLRAAYLHQSPKTQGTKSYTLRTARRVSSMAVNGTSSVDELSSTLKQFGLEEIPSFPNSHPTINPIDIYRAHITALLAPITGADPQIIYPQIAWTQTLDKGDCLLPVPALRIKGKKPDQLAKEICEKVTQPSPLL